mgnify:CR=1 FL=1
MTRLATLTAGSMLLVVGTLQADTPPDPNLAEAREIVKTFASQLQGELQAGLKAGGPVKAIAICAERAPAIAQEISAQTGWKVGRTSLKVRNTRLDSPDAWERQVMTDFARRQAAGEDVQTMGYGEVVTTGSGKQFRFMKAIPTTEVCLACHGKTITPEVAAALDARYPGDQARGFAVGDIRGAFSLSKPL